MGLEVDKFSGRGMKGEKITGAVYHVCSCQMSLVTPLVLENFSYDESCLHKVETRAHSPGIPCC